MPLKTLCGMFDDPVVKTPKKNFIRENIKSIKQLQDILQEAQKTEDSKLPFNRKHSLRLSREKLCSADRIKSNSVQNLSTIPKETCKNSNIRIPSSNPKFMEKTLSSLGRMQTMSKLKDYKIKKPISSNSHKPQYSNRSVQTDSVLGCGDISNSKELKDLESNNIAIPKLVGIGDNLQSKEQEKPTVNVPRQKKNIKNSEGGFHSVQAKIDPTPVPSTILEPSCPPGHVLLSEVERAETLKTLKQNYDKQVFQLNALSLTCDTLRIKRKRREIEEDLKKLDAAIKIFDRPRVFVKP